MGTRFIVSDEAETFWPRLPDQVLAASADESVWTTAFDVAKGCGQSQWPEGIGARSIRTPWVDRWAGHEDELAGRLTGESQPDHDDGGDPTPAYAGPIAGMVTQRHPAAQIITSIVADASEVLSLRQRWFAE